MTLRTLLRPISLLALASGMLAAPVPAFAQDADPMAAIVERLDRLERENAALRDEVGALRQAAPVAVAPPLPPPLPPRPAPARVPASTTPERSEKVVGIASGYSYAMLDAAEETNTKPIVQLQAIADGTLDSSVTLSGNVVAIANAQWSNADDTFGYLMRHPTGANQNGRHTSEAVLHSAKLAVTAKVARAVTAYAELLYDPQQSFGPGNITALTRNQLQLRRGWVMLGDLNRSPAYALIGKMDIPFGLNDTVNPFTNSTSWHAFAGLAYGAQAGYYDGNLHVRAMAVQGGSQFRGANVPVNGTVVPSRLNNFALDASYTADLSQGNRVRVGGSYLHGTAYCQNYPVVHFNPCDERNGAWAAYTKANLGDLTLIGEIARTTDVWAGTAVPDPTNPLSVFEPVKVTAFTLGSRYGFGDRADTPATREFNVSAEFSRFVAGDDGAPWEAQNQLVAGLSWFPTGNVNLFGEFARAEGFVPLNFLSGGNQPNGGTWSRQDVNTNVVLLGVETAF
ncbi:MAG: hypothetical protein WA954_07900 [Parerythrobacter sp.]